jgi:hypothetical protein
VSRLKASVFLFFKKTTNVNKTHQLIPKIGAAILGVMEPHCSNMCSMLFWTSCRLLCLSIGRKCAQYIQILQKLPAKIFNSNIKMELVSADLKKRFNTDVIGFYQPLDGIANSKYKFLHFLTTTFFYKEKKAQAFTRDRYCHLALCNWFSSIMGFRSFKNPATYPPTTSFTFLVAHFHILSLSLSFVLSLVLSLNLPFSKDHSYIKKCTFDL